MMLLFAILVAVGAVLCYGPIQDAVAREQKDMVEAYEQSQKELRLWEPEEHGQTQCMLQNGYLFYTDFQKMNSEEFLRTEEILLPDLAEQLGVINTRDLNTSIYQSAVDALSNAVLDWEQQFYQWQTEWGVDYYARDTKSGKTITNVADETVLEWIQNEACGVSGNRNLGPYYKGWIVLEYGEDGEIRLGSYSNLNSESVYRSMQTQRYENILTNYYDANGSSLPEPVRPRNMQVFYGNTQNMWEAAHPMETYWGTYGIYHSYGGDQLYFGVAFLSVLGAVFFAEYARRRELLRGGLLAIPMEFFWLGFLAFTGLYILCTDALIGTGLGIFVQGLVDMGFLDTAAHILVYGYNGLVWLCEVLVVMWSILILWPRTKGGLWTYLKERSLLLGTLPKWKQRFCSYISQMDITESANKTVIKWVLINLAVLTVLCCMWIFGVAGLILYSIGLYLLLRKQYGQLQDHYLTLLHSARQMAEGELNITLPQDLGVFNPLKIEILRIQNGFKQAVLEEVKSQRMKTELITNVSHDLKTPLTAIITYVNLLKEENITEEERDSYIQTLEKKSDRLKVLIEDLFEVSKAESQNMTLHLEEVDLVNLIKQVRLELEDKIMTSNLSFRWNLPEEKVLCMLDGQRTYRVFENLMVNILKYSMEGSRVYIDLIQDQGHVRVLLKNMSATELNFDPEEITERFVRGDLSRNTEGSGLGLAIARSFVELQGGSFRIEIDGDLFKVEILFSVIDMVK